MVASALFFLCEFDEKRIWWSKECRISSLPGVRGVKLTSKSSVNIFTHGDETPNPTSLLSACDSQSEVGSPKFMNIKEFPVHLTGVFPFLWRCLSLKALSYVCNSFLLTLHLPLLMPQPPFVFCLLIVFKLGLKATPVADFLLHKAFLKTDRLEVSH